MPFAREYPLILNSWVPTIVSVREVDDDEEVDGEGGGWDTDDVVDGFGRKSLWFTIVPINWERERIWGDSEFDVFLGVLFSMGIGFQAKVGEFENWDIQDLEMEKDFCFWVGAVWLCFWWIWLGNLKVGVSESDCELWGMIIEYHFYCEYLCCTIIGFFHFFSLQFFINFSIVYNYYF